MREKDTELLIFCKDNKIFTLHEIYRNFGFGYPEMNSEDDELFLPSS